MDAEPPVKAAGRPPSLDELWESLKRSMPEEVLVRRCSGWASVVGRSLWPWQAAPESEQIAYFRRVYAAYQQRWAMDRASRDAAVFRCIDRYREYIRAYYRPLHGDLQQLRNEFLDDAVVEALERGDVRSDLVEEVHPGVFRLPFFQLDFCKRLLEEIHHFEDWAEEVGLHINRPNSMNSYGAILDDIGFDGMLQQLTDMVVRPLSKELFEDDVGADSLDSHHGFVVEYELGRDRSLGFHVDDAEVTLNVCLGQEFEGGELFFRGTRCPQHQQCPAAQAEKFTFEHRPGYAVIHLGRHRHGAYPLRSGFRSNLILWCRSSSFRQRWDRDRCPNWCGMHGQVVEGVAGDGSGLASVCRVSGHWTGPGRDGQGADHGGADGRAGAGGGMRAKGGSAAAAAAGRVDHGDEEVSKEASEKSTGEESLRRASGAQDGARSPPEGRSLGRDDAE